MFWDQNQEEAYRHHEEFMRRNLISVVMELVEWNDY